MSIPEVPFNSLKNLSDKLRLIYLNYFVSFLKAVYFLVSITVVVQFCRALLSPHCYNLVLRS